jgi:hypothetical protein
MFFFYRKFYFRRPRLVYSTYLWFRYQHMFSIIIKEILFSQDDIQKHLDIVYCAWIYVQTMKQY